MKTKRLNIENISIIVLALLALIFIYNIVLTTSFSSKLKDLRSTAEEEARPAEIELLTIRVENCKNCFDVSQEIEKVKSGNVNVTSEKELTFEEAKDLVEKYNIKKLPTVIVIGELNKTNLGSDFVETNNALVFAGLKPVYFDTEKNSLVGLVEATIIKADNCEKCFDVDSILKQIKGLKVEVYKENVLTERTGSELIKKYGLKKLPALILSEGFKDYEFAAETWKALNGEVTSDGNYLLRDLLPPYKDLTDNQMHGLVTLTYLTDNSCKECYNVLLHNKILGNFGIDPIRESTIDISSSEGKSLATKYSITKVPTVVISSEAEVYPNFDEIFLQVGTNESDGYYVFRKTEIMGAYKDLSTNEVVKPKSSER